MDSRLGIAMVVATAVLTVGGVRQAHAQVPVGTVLFDFDINSNGCDPDNWNFFGTPTTDFGADPSGTGVVSEDGNGAFHTGDWLVPGGPFLGHGVGIGPFPPGQPLCGPQGSGIADINLDLSQGTGISMRVMLELPPGDFPPATQGTPGVRMQFQLIDSDPPPAPDDGDTVAVVPADIPGKPWIDRRFQPNGLEQWETVTIHFAALDDGFDNDAVAGNDPLNLADIKAIRMIWRPGPTSQNVNIIHFDEITLIGTPPVLWADKDSDNDVDLGDFRVLQNCFPGVPTDVGCASLDANRNAAFDDLDTANFNECLQGPGNNASFPSWCY
ncbi:MAG: hypothetical protein ACE5GE_00240 [Phycisphaerae bacterium]